VAVGTINICYRYLGRSSLKDTGAIEEAGSATAVLYLRVSTKEQAQRDGDPEGYSIPAQREACERKAMALGAAVIERFADRGESARSADRPELQRLLAYVKENHVDYVIVHKIDRLARNRADDVQITLAIKAAGATLVSCSENIDETPSGALLHGIMSSIAEFYSRNLANEVIKGCVQKAKTGGTVGKAPLGYLNVRRTENGRDIRSVEVDPVRGPLMKWAFETYATGEWSLQRLLDELTARGLTTTETANRPSRALYLSHLHKLMTHPYYKGVVRYRGIEYENGRHQRLVTPQVWQRVQDVLEMHNQTGERPRTHHHYLKGSLFCAMKDDNGVECGSRLIITNARSRSGRIYPYFVCAGRHQKRKNCTFKAVLIEDVEEKVIDQYALYQLTEDERAALETTLSEELSLLRDEATAEREKLLKRQRRLLNEREKLLQLHYADAIDADLVKKEQSRIRAGLEHIQQRLDATDFKHEHIDRCLKDALRLVTDVQATYIAAPDTLRRQLNQALFTRIKIDDQGEVTAELAEPFNILLSPEVRGLAKARRTSETPAERHQPNWDAWERSFNEEGAHDLVGASGTSRRPSGGRGLTYDTLVAPGGVEPPHADSKSAALSAELRGLGPGRRWMRGWA
jgi:site-specific DNA recombinase